MNPDRMEQRAYHRHAMESVSEGACPDHGGHLREDGWCDRCAAWWSIQPDRREGKAPTLTYPCPCAVPGFHHHEIGRPGFKLRAPHDR